MDEQPKPTVTQGPNTLNLTPNLNAAATAANIVPVAAVQPATSAMPGTGLTYANAHPDERKRMDDIIASIDLLKPDTITGLGEAEMKKLSDLADQALNHADPKVSMAVSDALTGLLNILKGNSLQEITSRVKQAIKSEGGVMGKLTSLFGGKKDKPPTEEEKRQFLTNFMTEVSATRKTIQEQSDALSQQMVTLADNDKLINELGMALTVAAQGLSVVHAATAEYIRRVGTGEITQLNDLTVAASSGRDDDLRNLQMAQANWGNVQLVDTNLVGAKEVFKMNIANEAFVNQANLQTSLQTKTALTTGIAQLKTQLTVFITMSTVMDAQKNVDFFRDVNNKSIETTQDMFIQLVNNTIKQSTNGLYDLDKIADMQNKALGALEGAGPLLEAGRAKMQASKDGLERSGDAFSKGVLAFNQRGGLFQKTGDAPQRAPKLPAAPAP